MILWKIFPVMCGHLFNDLFQGSKFHAEGFLNLFRGEVHLSEGGPDMLGGDPSFAGEQSRDSSPVGPGCSAGRVMTCFQLPGFTQGLANHLKDLLIGVIRLHSE